jgi:DNA-directed RNA polymerase sigma subunit (sigma70/sigma32)
MSEKSLQQYISEIANSILPAEEERRLILIYLNQEPDWQEAQNLVIKSNMMFVVKTAYEFSNDSQRILELISEGNLSLLESLNKFDPSKGFKFLTYASFNIRGRMLKYMLRSCNFSALKLSLKNIELATIKTLL